MSQPSTRLDAGDVTPKDTEKDNKKSNVVYYAGVLRRRIWDVIAITISVATITLLVIFITRLVVAAVYESTATAAIIPTFANVEFDSRFTTTSETMAGGNADTRRTALVALSKSGSIAQQVINQLGDQLPSETQNPAKLLKAVTTKMATLAGRPGQSDLIVISARANSPELAAAIANAWTDTFVQQVNSVYGQVPDDVLLSVDAQLVEAQATYATAQASFERYTADSQIERLSREIGSLTTTLNTLQQSRVNALNAYMAYIVDSYTSIIQTYVGAQADAQLLAFTKEHEGDRAQVTTYFDSYNADRTTIFANERGNRSAELATYYEQWLRTNSLLAAARTLQEQITSGDTPIAGNRLAMQALNLQIVNNASALSALQFQVDAGASVAVTDSTELVGQINATVDSLQSQLSTLEQNIERLNQDLLSGDVYQQIAGTVPVDSPLMTAIADSYASLFRSDVFTTAIQSQEMPLVTLGQEEALKFLGLVADGAQLTSNAPDAPMFDTMTDLEQRIRTLQSQLEVEKARSEQINQTRNLAIASVNALSSKQAELQLTRAAASSIVRNSGQAVPLDEPVGRISLLLSLILGAVIGLVAGIAYVLTAERLGMQPLVKRGAAQQSGHSPSIHPTGG